MTNPSPAAGDLAPPDALTPKTPSNLTRAVLSVWTWTEITVISITTFVVAVLTTILFGLFDRRRVVTAHVVRLGAVAAIKLNPLWHMSVKGSLPKNPPKKVVCVSNHCSHTDSFLISHLPWDMRWLAKASLFKIPFLGWAMWLAGNVAVVRGKSRSAKQAMAKCGELLERGTPIIIFPEGTRSTTREMLPFKDGAFRLAIETGAHLLPLAVAGTRTALPKHDWKAGYSVGALKVGELISTEGMTLEDMPALKATVREKIDQMRRELFPSVTE